MKFYPMYLGGEFTQGSGSQKMDILNPADGQLIAQVPQANRKDMQAAISAAREAFDKGPWKESTGIQRATVLFKIAAALREQADHLAELETLNMGKPIFESEYDLADAATCFEYFGGWATKIYGEVNPVPDNAVSMTLKEPVGVCGLIVPWNYPLLMAAWKLAPALAAGCTMVLKPAETTPLSVLELAKILDSIEELPKGVVNIVTGLGEEVGAELAENPQVDKIAFTGSTEVGRLIMKAAADSNLKKVTLELGGKSPNIFFEDADFEAAVENALFACFVNQGEVCSAGSRILVQRSIYDQFLEAMIAKTQTIQVGPGINRENKLGALVSEEHLNRVLGYIEKGKAEGARLVCGGERLGDSLQTGYFLTPTIFADVKNSMTIAQEEIFGPVACVIPFDSEEEAIAIANETNFGLAGAVWTRDIFRAFRVVKAVKAGILWVNHMQPTYCEAPWGGYKQSGTGRELGKYGVENFIESKQVHINLNQGPMGWY
ncbi:aldehyde dehydrogenase [bacterium (Candidatus Blackallbacteria) CG17_big_fil_post_rev_8_21_14_2_50_48_46]|uniref:Aldehyde dehydrogenase n=1 Tax=bacterium (Candidatus Blackallbacteria) CG17_big_fil_post_rev_8_21_14_2_50_48_46 TaxID=2014261 RepID=A0A2M7G5L1_9BACT|nr:MAG: aldehyde dehydrogenase [bacterium (Candidatus Blackallbacteria) CG18_big_fil_WC_8_21_14_2_50_49_26]PIW17262.1 MAG: aldehyde dehydrogenase [bacterium (Candidatus Blackallbacteria) CG17_big_fil_post_rev_8_21_14_2_50_48_46]PIW51054.1 MAG: aldehyde dehydrogenase [bacterium (Candidatus Blackallbacteria) CG13_big_fil_rev_8_21_14_2_50_49_14]